MNISWKWLAELVDLTGITPHYLAERLTLASFEVENINNNNNDTILEISTTTNRADTLSIIGIAREIGAILERPQNYINNHTTLTLKHKKLESNYQQCTDHIYTYINNITIKESPLWLKNRLISQDIQPKNNLHDILAFIAQKWGQHIEVFDLDIIQKEYSKPIELHTVSGILTEPFINRYNQKIVKNSKQEITTIKQKDNNTNIALAGITASHGTSIDDNTKNILIQSTICNRLYIKQISQILNLDTDESQLQIKGINSSDLFNAYSEAILLISNLCHGLSNITTYISRVKAIYTPIYIEQADISEILGKVSTQKDSKATNELDLNTIFKILNNLNLITHKFAQYLQIDIPLSRVDDIYRDIDIIEEIIRIYGFDHCIDGIPIHHKYGVKNIQQYNLAHIRSILRSIGMHETMHSSLIDKGNTNICIYNPLTEELKLLKNHLLSDLIKSYLYNKKQGNKEIEMFETGRIFNQINKTEQFAENIQLAGLISSKYSNRSNWSQKPTMLSWFQAKGDLEEFFERINIKITWKKINPNWSLYRKLHEYFHPKNIAMLLYQDKPIGIFGEVHLGLAKDKYNKLYGFEIIINELPFKIQKINEYIEYAKYPSITRDIQIKIGNDTPYDKISHTIQQIDNPLIESINLFDVYHDNTDKNIGLRITYRSNNTTLTNAQVNLVEETIKQQLYSSN